MSGSAISAKSYFDDFFMMTTANYPIEEFISVGRSVRGLLRKDQKNGG